MTHHMMLSDDHKVMVLIHTAITSPFKWEDGLLREAMDAADWSAITSNGLVVAYQNREVWHVVLVTDESYVYVNTEVEPRVWWGYKDAPDWKKTAWIKMGRVIDLILASSSSPDLLKGAVQQRQMRIRKLLMPV